VALVLLLKSPLPSYVELAADGTISIIGSAVLSMDVLLAGDGVVALSGDAWLTVREHGQDTFSAAGAMRLIGSARLSTDADPALPPTDDDGWTLPDVTTPNIRGLSVRLSGIALVRAQIVDLTIDLDVEGGPKAATITVNVPMDRRPRLGRDTLLVTYEAQTLFRGRLENIAGDVSSTTGYTLTYAGPLVTLRDHKAYRQVFVDSDLASWRTDQGPQTSPDTFHGIASGVW